MVYVRHEHCALAAAMAYSRKNWDVGVATVTCGPGVTQLITALPAAVRAHLPLVVFAGEAPLKSGWYNQEIDQAPLIAATGAAYHSLHMPERMPVAVRDAFLQARRERRPVVIGIPFDLQARPWDGPADLPTPVEIGEANDTGPSNAQVSAQWIRDSGAVDLTLAAPRRLYVSGDVDLEVARNLTLDTQALVVDDGGEGHLQLPVVQFLTAAAPRAVFAINMLNPQSIRLNDFTGSGDLLQRSVARLVQRGRVPRDWTVLADAVSDASIDFRKRKVSRPAIVVLTIARGAPGGAQGLSLIPSAICGAQAVQCGEPIP